MPLFSAQTVEPRLQMSCIAVSAVRRLTMLLFFCSNCGAATPNFEIKSDNQQTVINNTNTNVNKNVVRGYSKSLVLLMAIFFGWLGAHRVYVHKVGTGVIYMLTFGLCGIGWIIDIILIATGLFRDNLGHPLI